jgi:hypothetical protein
MNSPLNFHLLSHCDYTEQARAELKLEGSLYYNHCDIYTIHTHHHELSISLLVDRKVLATVGIEDISHVSLTTN